MLVALPDGYNINLEEVGNGFPLIVLHGGPGLDHHEFGDYLDPICAAGIRSNSSVLQDSLPPLLPSIPLSAR